jgi:hypothetical protein
MFLIRAAGLLVVLVGLVLVGISGDNHRVPNSRHILYGASLMAAGALVALFANQVGMLMGWTKP